MYNREKKPFPSSRHKNTPSFSSIVLDEIYHSIDDDSNSLKVSSRHYYNNAVPRMRRHSLVPQSDNDLSLFFSQHMNSHDYNDRSSSDTEMFAYDDDKARPSSNHRAFLSGEEEDHVIGSSGQRMDGSIKPKSSRASKIYAGLKKLKQPVSPGARLTSFIHSLFNGDSHGSKKKAIKGKVGSNSIEGLFHDRSKSADKGRKPSSGSSFSWSEARDGCCSRHSVIRKGEGCDRLYVRKPPLPPPNKSNSYYHRKHNYDEDGDGSSDSSSDLFELDHMALYGGDDVFEDLPVYETSRFHASHLLRVA